MAVPDIDAEVVSAEALRRRIEEYEARKAAEALARRRHAEEEEIHRREMFLHEHLHPEALTRLMARVEAAASHGQSEILLGSFPSAWLADRGRALNNGEAEWPHTLTGVAREFYAFYLRHLHPKGYKLRAEIMGYPGGVPGDVGLYLSW
jgi:hypothetical protein